MLDIKGADASKVVLVIGIMTLHSFGEGSGVGVSFAGSKGLSQGLLVTLAIAIHNIPEGLAVSMVLASRGVSPQNAMLWSVITSLPQPIVAVPSFICADTFHKFLPFCIGFAAGCMIWMVVAEVLPDGFKVTRQTLVKKFSSLCGLQLTNFQEHASLGDSVILCGDALVAVDFVVRSPREHVADKCKIFHTFSIGARSILKAHGLYHEEEEKEKMEHMPVFSYGHDINSSCHLLEATPSQVASAATLAVAFMESLSSVRQCWIINPTLGLNVK